MEATSLTFASPHWFWALAIVPAVIALYIWSQRRSRNLILKVVAPRLREQLAGAVSAGLRTFKAALVVLAFVCLVIALARPQWGFIQREVKQRGRDVIIAVDTSRSMLATDVSPTRLARAKLVAQDLLRLLRGDRVGLVAFAGSAFLQAPLTLDQGAVRTSLEELDTEVIPKGGTNIAAAIGAAEEAFGKAAEGKIRAMIILTDGEELDADGIAAARKAAEKGIRIFTVGIGSAEGSLIPLRNGTGGSEFVRDAQGKPVQSRLDETRLKEIAAAGGGFYQPLGPDVAGIIFEKGIQPIEMAETGVQTARQPLERYQWPLGCAIFLLFVWMVLGERRRVRAPQSAGALAALALLLAAGPALAGNGLDEYHAGNFDKAMTDFEQRLKTAPGSDKLQFNAGASAYKLGNYEKAVDHFTHALLTEEKELQEQASYNLANALVRRGEHFQEKDKKKADWKNAIQHYEETLKLDAENKEAKENRDLVKKMLEDLEKEEKQDQQKQDQQQDQQDQKNQDQKDQQNQQKNQQQQQNKDQQKKEQDKKDQQQQEQQQNQDQKGQQDQKNQDQKDQKDQQKSEGQQGNQNQEKGKNGENSKDQQNQKPPEEQKGGEQEKKEEQKPEDQKGDEQERQEMAQNRPQSGSKDKGQQQPSPQPTPGDKKEGDLKASQGNQPQQGQEGEAAGQAGEAEPEGQMTANQARGLLNSLRGEEERVQLMQRQEMEDANRDW